MFRGESRKWDTKITSTLFRNYPFFSKSIDNELGYYKYCFNRLYDYSTPFDSDINLAFLSFLRHNNYPTRLIDITPQIETALYFAVMDHFNETGYFYSIKGIDISYNMYNYEYADLKSVVDNRIFNNNLSNHYIFYKDTNVFNIKARRQHGWHIVKTGLVDKLVNEILISPEEKLELSKYFTDINYIDKIHPDLTNLYIEIIDHLEEIGK
jgi:hypothetical protein